MGAIIALCLSGEGVHSAFARAAFDIPLPAFATSLYTKNDSLVLIFRPQKNQAQVDSFAEEVGLKTLAYRLTDPPFQFAFTIDRAKAQDYRTATEVCSLLLAQHQSIIYKAEPVSYYAVGSQIIMERWPHEGPDMVSTEVMVLQWREGVTTAQQDSFGQANGFVVQPSLSSLPRWTRGWIDRSVVPDSVSAANLAVRLSALFADMLEHAAPLVRAWPGAVEIRPERTSTPTLSCSPNPFNPALSIRYVLPEAGHIILKAHDPTGQLVRVISDRLGSVGEHTVEWDGRDNAGRQLGSGVYFIRFTAPQMTEVRRVTLVR